MVATFHKGLFSFFILYDFGPGVLDVCSKLVLAVVRTLFDGLDAILQIVGSIAAGAFEKILQIAARTPRWLAAVAAGVIVAVLIWLVFDEKSRNKVYEAVNSLWKKAKPLVDKIVVWIVEGINTLLSYVMIIRPYAGITLTALVSLQKSIAALSEMVKSLEAQEF